MGWETYVYLIIATLMAMYIWNNGDDTGKKEWLRSKKRYTFLYVTEVCFLGMVWPLLIFPIVSSILEEIDNRKLN
jgi:hypothetical protein